LNKEENEFIRSTLDMVNKFVLFYVTIMSVAAAGSLYASYLNPVNPWHRVVVRTAGDPSATVKFDGDFYIFGIIGMGPYAQPYIAVANPLYNGGTSITYYAEEGETYGFYHIEMKVSEVQSDYVILLVKPLD
jgi:hypothetical protein